MVEIKYEMGELTIDKTYVGQRLFSLDYGWGTVEEIDLKSEHPILVTFDSGGRTSYSSNLREFSTNLYPNLFENEPIIIIPAIKVTKRITAYAELIQDDQGQVYLGSLFSSKEDLQRLSTSAKFAKNVLKIVELDYEIEVTEEEHQKEVSQIAEANQRK